MTQNHFNFNYPSQPRKLARQKDPWTSHEAANKSPMKRTAQKFKALEQFVLDRYSGGKGITDREAAKRACFKCLESGPRRASELRGDHLIEIVGSVTGDFGSTVRTSTATAAGCKAYELTLARSKQ